MIKDLLIISNEYKAALYYTYCIATDNGFDYREKSNAEREDSLLKYSARLFGATNKRRIDFCIKKFNFKTISLVELQEKVNDLYDSEKDNVRHGGFLRLRLCCCNSCHTGTSRTPLTEVISQREKYGEYICKSCEETAVKLSINKDIRCNYRKGYISKDGVYYDDGVASRGTKMLGFGGRWFLLKTKSGNWITNNLFVQRSMHEKLLHLFKHNVNLEIVGINTVDDIKNNLNADEFNEILSSKGYEIFNYK